MSKGISLHIGVNKLHVGIYDSEAPLCSPANDATCMASIAKSEGYECICVLTNQEASKGRFLECFDKCIAQLEEGDTFFLTFSGHGGQINDANGDEQDGMDEVWCFHDEPVVDDDLAKKWREFKRGVRVIVVSASCHSRSSLKVWTDDCFSESPLGTVKACQKEVEQNGKSILEAYLVDSEIKASILHISACEDEQEARDGNTLSRFTDLLVKYWNNGNFTGTYEDLVKKINTEAGYTQRAGIATLGLNDPKLLASRPFKILTK